MDLRDKTFWEMVKESISYARKNENVWAAKAVIAEKVVTLEENESELDGAFKAKDENDPGGHIAQKNLIIEAFCHKIYKLGRKLLMYAKDKNDKVLLNDVDFAESKLLNLSEKKQLIKCNTVIKRGNEYLSLTADYDVTAEELDALAAELATIEKMQPTIGVITNERKNAGRSVKELIAEARLTLSKLDDGFEGMIDDETFLNGWFDIRKIKGRHKTPAKNNNGTPGDDNGETTEE